MDSGKSLRETLKGKPSLAVKVMIKGLDNPPPNFRIDMDSFGFVKGNWCIGCAATVALQEITGHVFSTTEIIDDRHLALGLQFLDVAEFELALDSFRVSDTRQLGKFCGVKMPAPAKHLKAIFHKDYWPTCRQDYVDYQKQLEESGL